MGTFEWIERAGARHRAAGPERPQDCHGLLEPGHPLRRVGKRDAVGSVLGGVATDPDAERQPAVRRLLERRGHPRKDCRVAVHDVRDERHEANSRGGAADRGERGPGLEHRVGSHAAADEMVPGGDPGVAGLVETVRLVAPPGERDADRPQVDDDGESRARHRLGPGGVQSPRRAALLRRHRRLLVGGRRPECTAPGRGRRRPSGGRAAPWPPPVSSTIATSCVDGFVTGPRRIGSGSRRTVMGEEFFTGVKEPIRFGGLGSPDPLTFKVYEPDRVVLGKRMEDHLRIGVCFWHSFAWAGTDMFGLGTFDRPWLDASMDPMGAARMKLAAAFEFFTKLGIPWYCFHDRDVAPEGATFAEFKANLDALADDAAGYQERTGVRLLWGTANLFSHPRYQAGASTNPDPEVFAYAAAQVKHMLEVTKRLGGENYVLWGGREGYDTLLNTDLRREGVQLARFLHLVAEHKHKIGFAGMLLIEPKPQEPTKHQYDYDSATVHGFLVRNGLEGEYRLNIEANHATLAGHSFHHEVAYAVANGMFGSIDANRGDPQNGWDTDQFPNSVDDLAMPLYEILRGGGFTTGGFNFDAKLRRQSIGPDRSLPRPHRRDRHPRPGAPGGRGDGRGR